MKRRGLLAGVTTGMAAFAGCLDELGISPVRPAEIEESQFETDVETDIWEHFGPDITADQEAAEVTVEGNAPYGSSTCGYLYLQQIDYDPEEAVLRVRIDDGQEDPPEEIGGCEDDVGGDSYRLVVRFDEGVPERVEARQPFNEENTEEFK